MAVTRFADAAPVPVFVARGLGAHRDVARLWADPGVDVVRSPRHATVLVVAGAVPLDHAGPLRRLHDQVPAPRGVAALGVDGDLRLLGFGTLPPLPSDGELAPALRDVQAAALDGTAASPAVGPADNPVDWQGVGPHGQGGEGMMGGTPYGRMMPMPPVEGRDGLALDRLSVRLGPFLPGLPAGLALDAGLQGDVLEDVAIAAADLDRGLVGTPTTADEATRLLVALAEVLAVAGLDALTRRAARVALAPDHHGLAALRRRLDRPWGLRAATDGVGVLPDGHDATARWRRWLDRVAAPTGPWPRAVPSSVGEALAGMELGRAMLTLASLQPDLELSAVPAGAA